MLFSFRPKHEVITRSYDVTGSGFATLPVKSQLAVSDSQEFVWTMGLIKNLGAIYASIFFSALGYGILTVMIAFKLEAFVRDEILISISTASQIGAGVLFSRFLPQMGQKFGLINTIYAGSILSIICALLIYFYFGYFWWLLLIFFLGASFFICGVTRNTIMIDLAPRHVRCMIISCGGMLVAIGNSFGPVIMNFLQLSEGMTPLVIASLFYVVSIFPLMRLKSIEANIREEKKIGLGRYIKNSPKIMLAGFAVSYAISSTSAFLIIYGIKIGMAKTDASLLLSAFLFGAIFSIPLGYVADFLNRRFLMISFACLAFVIATILFFHDDMKGIHLLLFLLFGSLGGIKLPAVVLINEKYKPTQRLAVNSAFSRICLTGNICGFFCTGIIIKFLGPQGLWASTMFIMLVFLAFCAWNYWQKKARNELKLSDFSFFNKKTPDEQFADG
jgi:MFS family permease